ncbi:hypothetical protein IAU60_000421 [Kwoniella sp. DSM 27419]
MPFLHKPTGEDDRAWLRKDQEAPDWLNLLYDLAVVAVLTIFSTNHELNKPSAIPIFLSYYVIVCWVWTAQIHYDIRYQAHDGWHRIAKAIQIVTLVLMGAASGNWNPGLIRDDEDYLDSLSGADASAHRCANESFVAVLSAFAASRVFLGLQHLVCAWNGHRAGRSSNTHILSFGAVFVSCAITVMVVLMPATSDALTAIKIGLSYLAICIEVLGSWLPVDRDRSHLIQSQVISARYGCFTLIVIGEGFISITRASNLALSGFSITNTMTYAQVFLAIAIMYLLFLFLFENLDREGEVSEPRSLAWESLHFPMHFNLLLLLAAMVVRDIHDDTPADRQNAIVVLSFAQGVSSVAKHYISTIDSIVNGTELTYRDQRYVVRYIDQLYLQPSYATEMSLLKNLGMTTNPPEDPTILAYQYLGQIMFQVTNSYGIDLEATMLQSLQDLYAVNTTWSGDTLLQATRQDTAFELVRQILQQPTDSSLSGVLWLFPTAGAALILATARSALWHSALDGRTPIKRWMSSGVHVVLGVALSCLGLLDIGSRKFDALGDDGQDQLESVNLMYWLVHTRTPLVIVLATYLLAYFADLM